MKLAAEIRNSLNLNQNQFAELCKSAGLALKPQYDNSEVQQLTSHLNGAQQKSGQSVQPQEAENKQNGALIVDPGSLNRMMVQGTNIKHGISKILDEGFNQVQEATYNETYEQVKEGLHGIADAALLAAADASSDVNQSLQLRRFNAPKSVSPSLLSARKRRQDRKARLSRVMNQLPQRVQEVALLPPSEDNA